MRIHSNNLEKLQSTNRLSSKTTHLLLAGSQKYEMYVMTLNSSTS